MSTRMNIKIGTSLGLMLVICSALRLAAYPPSSNGITTQPTSKPASPVTYRLSRVLIPSGSTYRTKNSNCPKIFVIVKKDGEMIGKASDAEEGFEVVFKKNARNQYKIDPDDGASYSVEVWDYSLFWWSKLIMGRTGLNQCSFDEPIREELGSLSPREHAITVEFKRL